MGGDRRHANRTRGHPACPACTAVVEPRLDDFVCAQGHRFSARSFLLATNVTTLNALWRAIRALDEDAVGLLYMADLPTTPSPQAERYHREAVESRAAADSLREYARTAQARLDAFGGGQEELS